MGDHSVFVEDLITNVVVLYRLIGFTNVRNDEADIDQVDNIYVEVCLVLFVVDV